METEHKTEYTFSQEELLQKLGLPKTEEIVSVYYGYTGKITFTTMTKETPTMVYIYKKNDRYSWSFKEYKNVDREILCSSYEELANYFEETLIEPEQAKAIRGWKERPFPDE